MPIWGEFIDKKRGIGGINSCSFVKKTGSNLGIAIFIDFGEYTGKLSLIITKPLL